MRTTWPQALAWRLRRHLLDPVGTGSSADVVGTLGAVPAHPDDAAELAVRVRRQESDGGDVARALADGTLIKSFAFRGATHLMTPEHAAAFLALRASSRMWELPSWQTFYGLAPDDWPPLRHVVRDALADGPLTVPALGEAVVADPRYRHLAQTFADGPWTLLKAFAWQGDLCFGPDEDGQTTFQRLDDNPRWTGLLDLDAAGARAVEAYLRAYGPTTARHLQYWLGEGLGSGRRNVQRWVADLGDRLAEVDVDGEPAALLRDDLDELAAASPSHSLRLLPRYDQWVLGPGTADAHVVPPERRAVVSRGAAVVVVGGVVHGTWSLDGDDVRVDWFSGRSAAREALDDEVGRLAAIVGRPLRPPEVP
ncbi:crosslink repair DNA glycosylase YcaQ family protein [Cellulomonas sp.]|uniref:DNA glycosylase AlkZ-like family protein n=1 Tax=Cellulomonas sp. TaxID=40001 RepID=UPI001B2C539B|nr:crosslink repair DNA glycosylase YcaQ family protein [Cellulomonas sp.]MBO9554371.1 winged helix DNA-binding domain-containing protein [Cellulomonas sp.]